MGFFEKVKGFVNPDSIDDGYEGDYDGFMDESEDMQAGYNEMYGQAQNTAQSMGAANNSGLSINSNALELKVVRPDRFGSVCQIADHLLNKRTVVLNLEATNKETSRRIIDFLSGVAYSISGNLKRVANNTFVITPCNVDVSNDQPEDKKADQQTYQKQAQSDPYDNI